MSHETYNVAAYITAYEDADALNACVRAIRAQSYAVKHILIVDNSFERLALTDCEKTTLEVWWHPENIGIAGGLKLALEWALAQGYDFLWTFDQDSVPTPECLKLLLETYASHVSDRDAIGIVAPTPVDARTGETVKPSLFHQDHFRGYDAPDQSTPYECDAPITSGSLVWLPTLERVMPPDPALFIDGIDLEYGLRLRKAGYHHLVVPTALMYHRFGDPLPVKVGNRKKVIQRYTPLRYYYICRNQTWIELQHAQGWYRLTCGLRRLRYLLMTIAIILLFDAPNQGTKIYACLKGTWDGFTGRLGKTW